MATVVGDALDEAYGCRFTTASRVHKKPAP